MGFTLPTQRRGSPISPPQQSAYGFNRSIMANYLAHFQTIKNACDRLVIAGMSSLPLSSPSPYSSMEFSFFFFLVFAVCYLDLNVLVWFGFRIPCNSENCCFNLGFMELWRFWCVKLLKIGIGIGGRGQFQLQLWITNLTQLKWFFHRLCGVIFKSLDRGIGFLYAGSRSLKNVFENKA